MIGGLALVGANDGILEEGLDEKDFGRLLAGSDDDRSLNPLIRVGVSVTLNPLPRSARPTSPARPTLSPPLNTLMVTCVALSCPLRSVCTTHGGSGASGTGRMMLL